MATAALVPISAYLSKTWRPDREYVDGELLERNLGSGEHSRVQMYIAAILFRLEGELGLSVRPQLRVRVKLTRFRIPDICVILSDAGNEPYLDRPPFICVEILSRDDTMSSMQERIADLLGFGVPYIWVIDPRLKLCFAYTPDGMRAISEGDLVTANLEIRLPLSVIFG